MTFGSGFFALAHTPHRTILLSKTLQHTTTCMHGGVLFLHGLGEFCEEGEGESLDHGEEEERRNFLSAPLSPCTN